MVLNQVRKGSDLVAEFGRGAARADDCVLAECAQQLHQASVLAKNANSSRFPFRLSESLNFFKGRPY